MHRIKQSMSGGGVMESEAIEEMCEEMKGGKGEGDEVSSTLKLISYRNTGKSLSASS